MNFETRNQLELIQIKLERVAQIHNILFENYFNSIVDYSDTSQEMQTRIVDLCIRYPAYTALLGITDDYTREIITELNAIIEQPVTQ